MKALSIQQPWAWLIVNGYKTVENRSWHGHHCGALLIHAGLKLDHDGYEWVMDTFTNQPLPPRAMLDRGGIVGRVHMAECVTKRAGDPWFFGPYGFVFTRPEVLPFTPLRGQLGFFEVAWPLQPGVAPMASKTSGGSGEGEHRRNTGERRPQ